MLSSQSSIAAYGYLADISNTSSMVIYTCYICTLISIKSALLFQHIKRHDTRHCTVSTYHKGRVQLFQLRDQKDQTTNYEQGHEEPCCPVGGGDVPVANRGDGYHHEPVGVKESETFVDAHEVV